MDEKPQLYSPPDPNSSVASDTSVPPSFTPVVAIQQPEIKPESNPKQKTNWKKWLAISLAILAIIIILSIFFYWRTLSSQSKKSNSKAVPVYSASYKGWQTYRSRTTSVSFKYPPDWIFYPNPAGGLNITKDVEDIYIDGPTRTINGKTYQFALEFDIKKDDSPYIFSGGGSGNQYYSTQSIVANNLGNKKLSLVVGRISDPTFGTASGAASFIEIGDGNYKVGYTSDTDSAIAINNAIKGYKLQIMGSFGTVDSQSVAFNNASFDTATFESQPDVKYMQQIAESLSK
jgi:hypothetical protein